MDKFFKDLSDEDVDEMLEEWRTFQVMPDLPPFKDVPADGNPPDQPDAWWAHIFKMKGPSGVTTFDKLKELIHVLLILPYDQVPVERVFSMVNKIDTKFRPSIGNTTVCALLACKINSEVPCQQLNVSVQLLHDVRAVASKRNNDLRVVREEAAAAAAANEVAVGSDDESDDDWL